MAERGSDKHSAELDDQMKHEAEGGVKGAKPGHREDSRETEPFTDETDSQEVQDAPERTDLTSNKPPTQAE